MYTFISLRFVIVKCNIHALNNLIDYLIHNTLKYSELKKLNNNKK